MIKNYFKIAIRNLIKNKTYVLINLLGLGFALGCCIIAYINYDYRNKFDAHYKNTEQVYRINSYRNTNQNIEAWGVVPAPLGKSVKENVAGIENLVRLNSKSVIVKAGQKVFNETIHYADTDLKEVFAFPLKEGSMSVLKDRSKILISERLASKYFNRESALGKSLKITDSEGKEKLFEIGAVLGKVPLNSSFQFDILTSIDNFFGVANSENNWAEPAQLTTFVKVKNQSSVKNIESALIKYSQLYNEANRKQEWKISKFYLQPFQDLPYTSDVDMANFVKGSALTSNPRGVALIVPTVMSVLILLIACFNFTNTSIAFSSSRLKEIGIRKVMGSLRIHLIKQFMIENLILCFAALLLAIVFATRLIPLINETLELDLSFNLQKNYLLIPVLVLLSIVTAFVSGFYPAFYISSHEPVSILKGKTKFATSGIFTKILLTAQFAICSLALIIGIILTQNAYYQENLDFGYDIKNLAVAELNGKQEFQVLHHALKTNPIVSGIAGAENQVGAYSSNSAKAITEKVEGNAQLLKVGGNYLEITGIKLSEGRQFNYALESEYKHSIIVNETFVKEHNLKSPLNSRVRIDSANYQIVGIAKDFKELGTHAKVPSCVIMPAKEERYRFLVMRCDKKDLRAVNEALQQSWLDNFPEKPFQGFLQEDVIEKETRLNNGFKNMSFALSLITMLLSAAGLYSLVSLNILKRMKEIGVRKVLGASILQLMALINKGFVKIILIGFVLGSSIGYLFVSKVIFNFIYAYHTDINLLVFLLSLLILLTAALSTVGLKIFRAATINPVDTLRNE